MLNLTFGATQIDYLLELLETDASIKVPYDKKSFFDELYDRLIGVRQTLDEEAEPSSLCFCQVGR
jgi:hypothetical protein